MLQPSSDTRDTKLEPTAYFMTLFKLLTSNTEDPPHVVSATNDEELHLPNDSFCSLSSLMPLTQCKEVDCLILHLLQRHPNYISVAAVSLLSCCLEHPTEERIEIASLLVKNNPVFRAKFEQQCLNIKENWSVAFRWCKAVTAYLSWIGSETPYRRGKYFVLLYWDCAFHIEYKKYCRNNYIFIFPTPGKIIYFGLSGTWTQVCLYHYSQTC